MNRDDRRLMRHLVTAVVVKLIVLVVLWWLFVPHALVPTGSEQTAAHLAAPVHPAAEVLPHANNNTQETAP